jgi:hypothetical protein
MSIKIFPRIDVFERYPAPFNCNSPLIHDTHQEVTIDITAMQSTVCLLLPSYIEIGLFLIMRSSLKHPSLFQADEDEESSD